MPPASLEGVPLDPTILEKPPERPVESTSRQANPVAAQASDILHQRIAVPGFVQKST